MKDEIVTVVKVYCRYDTADENGEKRRDRNEKFGHDSPVLDVPVAGRYLWEWYFDLSKGLRRVRDGICEPIPHTEFQAWVTLSGNIVYSVEYGILRDMDVAFCEETNKELADFRERERERNKQT